MKIRCYAIVAVLCAAALLIPAAGVAQSGAGNSRADREQVWSRAELDRLQRQAEAELRRVQERLRSQMAQLQVQQAAQIGRASCRERV